MIIIFPEGTDYFGDWVLSLLAEVEFSTESLSQPAARLRLRKGLHHAVQEFSVTGALVSLGLDAPARPNGSLHTTVRCAMHGRGRSFIQTQAATKR